jgi:hypothetical protein
MFQALITLLAVAEVELKVALVLQAVTAVAVLELVLQEVLVVQER